MTKFTFQTKRKLFLRTFEIINFTKSKTFPNTSTLKKNLTEYCFNQLKLT